MTMFAIIVIADITF